MMTSSGQLNRTAVYMVYMMVSGVTTCMNEEASVVLVGTFNTMHWTPMQ